MYRVHNRIFRCFKVHGTSRARWFGLEEILGDSGKTGIFSAIFPVFLRGLKI